MPQRQSLESRWLNRLRVAHHNGHLLLGRSKQQIVTDSRKLGYKTMSLIDIGMSDSETLCRRSEALKAWRRMRRRSLPCTFRWLESIIGNPIQCDAKESSSGCPTLQVSVQCLSNFHLTRSNMEDFSNSRVKCISLTPKYCSKTL